MRFLAHISIPLNVLAHVQHFEWTSKCDVAFWRLKVKILKVPIMVPLNWDQHSHVFVDASDKEIGSVLMLEKVPGWFWLVCYAS